MPIFPRPYTIRNARPQEAEWLSELAVRSKGYWGYSPEFLEACLADPAQHLFVACEEGRVIGQLKLTDLYAKTNTYSDH